MFGVKRYGMSKKEVFEAKWANVITINEVTA